MPPLLALRTSLVLQEEGKGGRGVVTLWGKRGRERRTRRKGEGAVEKMVWPQKEESGKEKG